MAFLSVIEGRMGERFLLVSSTQCPSKRPRKSSSTPEGVPTIQLFPSRFQSRRVRVTRAGRYTDRQRAREREAKRPIQGSLLPRLRSYCTGVSPKFANLRFLLERDKEAVEGRRHHCQIIFSTLSTPFSHPSLCSLPQYFLPICDSFFLPLSLSLFLFVPHAYTFSHSFLAFQRRLTRIEHLFMRIRRCIRGVKRKLKTLHDNNNHRA